MLEKTSNARWVQLALGLIVMMAISSPQYVWTLFVAPFHVFTPPLRAGISSSAQPGQDVAVHQVWVPIDDEHNYFFSFRCNRSGPLKPTSRCWTT